MDSDDIIEALEATTPCPRTGKRHDRVRTADRADTVLWKRQLLRFLGEIDESLTVGDVRRALEEY